MNCFRSVSAVNNTTIVNTFNSDNSNIAYIKIQIVKSWQPLKFEPMIKIPVEAV